MMTYMMETKTPSIAFGGAVLFTTVFLVCEAMELLFNWAGIPRYPYLKIRKTANFRDTVLPYLGFSTIFLSIYGQAGLSFDHERSFLETIPRLIVGLLWYDFTSYWVHRAQHEIPTWWKIHWTHHSVALYSLDVMHASLIEFAEYGVGFTSGQLMLGLDIWEVWAMTFIAEVHGAIIHSGRVLPWMDACDRWLVGSRFHAIHHTSHRGNYGNMFTFWDDYFGTANRSEKARALLFRKRDNADPKKD